jgi:DNA invertase Pin-like site-specific DNA recombinase
VVTKLDRLARSVPDARDIISELTDRGVRLQIAGFGHDPTDPVGRLLFNVLAMVAESRPTSSPPAPVRVSRSPGRRGG